MKKTMKRVLCFFLALVVMISMPLDIQAKAVALELSWVTWALISYLTAVGFTFAVTGGIEALQSEVEEKVDTYYELTGVDLFGVIIQSLQMKPSNNGNGNGFWFGAAAVVAIAEFIEWVMENGWSAGEDILNTIDLVYLDIVYKQQSETVKLSTLSSEYFNSVNKYGQTDIISLDNIIPLTIDFDDTSSYQTLITGTDLYAPTNYKNATVDISFYNSSEYIMYTVTDGFASGQSYSVYLKDLQDISSWDELIGLSYFAHPSYNDRALVGLIFTDNTSFVLNEVYSPIISSQNVSSSITSPEEITEFEVEEEQAVQVDFSVFEDTTTKETPEELAEAVKQQIIDTGTVPTIVTEIVTVTETEPEPTSEPTPIPSPEIEDIDDLGLPSLGTALFNKFPFSLPKDLKRIADILNADRVTPVWEVDLYETLGDRIPFRGDTTLRIDLGEYEEIGQITRWASVISFAIFLIIITKGMIRW